MALDIEEVQESRRAVVERFLVTEAVLEIGLGPLGVQVKGGRELGDAQRRDAAALTEFK